MCLLGQYSVGFKDKGNGFVQVRAGFFECHTLGIGARQLLDEPDVAFGDAAENGRELKIHACIIRGAGRFCSHDLLVSASSTALGFRSITVK